MPDNNMPYNDNFQNACRTGEYQAVVDGLLQVDINQKDIDGNTPLHCVCEGGHSDILDLLLEQSDLNIDAKNNKGETALHVICSTKENRSDELFSLQVWPSEVIGLIRSYSVNVKFLISLLKRSASLCNVQDMCGETAFFRICHNGNFEAATAMLIWGGDKIDLSLPTEIGQTPLSSLLMHRKTLSEEYKKRQQAYKKEQNKKVKVTTPLLKNSVIFPPMRKKYVCFYDEPDFINANFFKSSMKEVSSLISSVLSYSQDIVLRGLSQEGLDYIFDNHLHGSKDLLCKTICIIGEDSSRYEKRLIMERRELLEKLLNRRDDDCYALSLLEKSYVIACVNPSSNFGDPSILEKACTNGSIELVRAMLEHESIDWSNNICDIFSSIIKKCDVQKVKIFVPYIPQKDDNFYKCLVAAFQHKYTGIARSLLLKEDLDIVRLFKDLPTEYGKGKKELLLCNVFDVLFLAQHQKQPYVVDSFECYVPFIFKIEQLQTLLDAVGIGKGKECGTDHMLSSLRMRKNQYRETNDSEKLASLIFKQAKAILAEQNNQVFSEDEYREYHKLFSRCIVRKPTAKTRKAQEEWLEWLDNDIQKNYQQQPNIRM